jgi:hypothetical protein
VPSVASVTAVPSSAIAKATAPACPTSGGRAGCRGPRHPATVFARWRRTSGSSSTETSPNRNSARRPARRRGGPSSWPPLRPPRSRSKGRSGCRRTSAKARKSSPRRARRRRSTAPLAPANAGTRRANPPAAPPVRARHRATGHSRSPDVRPARIILFGGLAVKNQLLFSCRARRCAAQRGHARPRARLRGSCRRARSPAFARGARAGGSAAAPSARRRDASGSGNRGQQHRIGARRLARPIREAMRGGEGQQVAGRIERAGAP